MYTHEFPQAKFNIRPIPFALRKVMEEAHDAEQADAMEALLECGPENYSDGE